MARSACPVRGCGIDARLVEVKAEVSPGRPRRLLMVAYHFPPLAGSSGIQRTLRLVQQLPELGWQPLVLTTHPRAYERVAPDLLAEVPTGTEVRRAFALDTARHLSLGGRYFGAMAVPDRWQSWRFDGVRQGMQLIRRFKPDAIWSTFPIATAHLIAMELQRRSGLPWVADFRDPMAQDGYPPEPRLWQAFERIERAALRQAARSVFTTPGAARIYRQRYPDAASRIRVIENGYDEDSFSRVERRLESKEPLIPGVVTLLHSGIVYPEERDPAPLMAALGQLRAAGRFGPDGLRLRFRSAVHDDLIRNLARQHGVDDMVETLPPVEYAEALQEMLRADGLLVMQSAGCNEQIPAKMYEYLRARRPILCLSDPAGDTADLMRRAGLSDIGRLDDAQDIARALGEFVDRLRRGAAQLPSPPFVASACRMARSKELADLLGELLGSARSH